MNYFVEIVRFKDQAVVKRIECGTEDKAKRVDDGANINLNHDQYFTRIVAEDVKPEQVARRAATAEGE